MAMLNAPAMECDRVNLRWSVPVQKRQQIFETVPVRHRGTSFRVGQTFLMQLHRSRPEPRLSTFERCWLGGATGRVRSPWRSSQATCATYSRSRSPGSVSLCRRTRSCGTRVLEVDFDSQSARQFNGLLPNSLRNGTENFQTCIRGNISWNREFSPEMLRF